MVKRKLDNRVRTLIENGLASGHRTLFIIVGDKSKDQVIYLHHILSKACLKQANILWCYKHKLEFSSNRKKRMKQLKAKQRYGNVDLNEDDPFEMFVSMTEIRYCYYKETHKILGNTFKMCVLQDFESLTPNILCRAVETVEGGGIIAILLESMTSLKQLYTLNMDVHARYRTEAHQVVVPRFNERFILSLSSCPNCIVLNDQLNIIPISSLTKHIEPLPFTPSNRLHSKEEMNLKLLKEKYQNVKPLGTLLSLSRTFDQANVVKEFVEAITENTLSSTITLTAARGRGKSAAMGLALAGAILVGYSNMFVTSPSPENLNTFFEFLLKGLDALGYEKHIHYQTLASTDPEHHKAMMRVTVQKEHRQFVQYISPYESDALDNAELLVIDEAAAIPLPQVQALMGPYLVFLASTVSGYEGTGRSLSLKLIKDLREKTKRDADSVDGESKVTNEEGTKKIKLQNSSTKRKLVELSLEEPIRYASGDHVEKWLYNLLCLESPVLPIKGTVPDPKECQLYYVNRDMLFCYHKMTEKFLSTVVSLLVASHYRNTPDDLQILSDAPSHSLFVLLPPTDPDASILQVFCVLQVAFEGKISKVNIEATDSGKRKPAGDMIPWTIKNFFDDDDFPQLSGVRIVRIATHPDLQGRGFGSQAVRLLEEYYARSSHKASTVNVVVPKEKSAFSSVKDEEIGYLKESEDKKTKEPDLPLLLSTEEREPEPLHYLGVSFGASHPLVRFWKKNGFTLVYMSQVKNPQTGEFTALFLKVLNESKTSRDGSWLRELHFNFKDIMVHLLQGPFRQFDTKFALSLLTDKVYKRKPREYLVNQLKSSVSEANLTALELYLNHMKEFPQIANLFERLAVMYFEGKIPTSKMKTLRQAILVGAGVQMKHTSVVAQELDLEHSIVMAEIYSIVTELQQYFRNRYADSADNYR